MKLGRGKKIFIVIAAIYMTLWILTATWGIMDVDKAFDREFAYGYKGMEPNKSLIPRIRELSNYEDLMDPANHDALSGTDGLFRSRTTGYPIAPFIIIDKAAAIFANLGGFGATRFNVWFFGYTKWWMLKGYWAV